MPDIGNTQITDEGIGIHVLQTLEPGLTNGSGVRLVEGGKPFATAGLIMTPWFSGLDMLTMGFEGECAKSFPFHCEHGFGLSGSISSG